MSRLSSYTVNAVNEFLRGTLGVEIKRSRSVRKMRESWLRSLGIRSVVDVGANAGQFARFISSTLPDAMIYSFEPLPDCIAQIEMLARAARKVRVFPYACGDSNSVIEFHRSTFSPSSSLLPMATRHKELFPFTAGGTTLDVEVRRLDDVLNNEDLRDRILVKLDVQGFEDRVIRGGRTIITRAAVVLTEMNFERLYENQADFDLTYRSLMDCGFEFRGMWEQSVDRATGCPIFGDALFTRRGDLMLQG